MKKTEKKIPVEVYSRIVGYFRPVNQWNKGKQEEFHDRKEFTISEIKNDYMKQEATHGMDDK